MTHFENNLKPYSKTIIQLLKSPISSASSHWKNMLAHQKDIQDYLNVIGLELIIKEEDGFAFVKQFIDSEGQTQGLVRRQAVGFKVSVLIVMLRQILEDFDNKPTDYHHTEKFITRSDIKEELDIFLPSSNNKAKFWDKIDQDIEQVVKLGYLKKQREDQQEVTYSIHRIIKEKVTVDMLHDFKEKLVEYVGSI